MERKLGEISVRFLESETRAAIHSFYLLSTSFSV